MISTSKNVWHCLGACRKGGSPIDWVLKAEGVSFRHAVELLHADYSGSSPASNEPPPKHTRTRKLEAPISADADDAAALAKVVAYHHDTLKQSPEALAYLQSRGLRSAEMIDHFKLGFANRTLGCLRTTRSAGRRCWSPPERHATEVRARDVRWYCKAWPRSCEQE